MRWVKEATKHLFWNSTERRWRAGWRVVLYSALWLTIQVASSTVITSSLTTAFSAVAPAFAPIAGALLFYIVNALLVIAMTWLLAWRIDYRPLADLGLRLDRHDWEDLCFGLLLGAGLMSLIFLVEWGLGWITVTAFFHTTLPNTAFRIAIWQPILLFIAVGINEELLSRGYQLRNLAEGFNLSTRYAHLAVSLAWLLSSLIFGFLHIFNPNSTWVSTVALMLAGILLGAGYVLTGRLGLPIGLHITWNFFQGSVYGFRVSGNDLSNTTFIAIQQLGPRLWTGGAFGPEAGLIGIVAMLLGLGGIVLWVRWRYGAVTLQTALAYYRDRRQPLSYHEAKEQGVMHVN